MTKTTNDPLEVYKQLTEIKDQLFYLGLTKLGRAAVDQLEGLWALLDAQEHKELALWVYDRENWNP